MKNINWEEEYKKCMESPYYFATNYVMMQSKIHGEPIKFKTSLSESEFNNLFKATKNQTLV